jgi:hypothetical protein
VCRMRQTSQNSLNNLLTRLDETLGNQKEGYWIEIDNDSAEYDEVVNLRQKLHISRAKFGAKIDMRVRTHKLHIQHVRAQARKGKEDILTQYSAEHKEAFVQYNAAVSYYTSPTKNLCEIPGCCKLFVPGARRREGGGGRGGGGDGCAVTGCEIVTCGCVLRRCLRCL